MQGLTYGGVYGTIRGLQTARVPSFNVRVNAILNQMTRYGPWAANSMGIMSIFHSCSNIYSHVLGYFGQYL